VSSACILRRLLRGGGVTKMTILTRRKFLSLSTNVAAALAARKAIAGLLPLGGGVSPTQFAITSLITGINNGLAFEDDHGGNTGIWTSDGTGNFGRLNYAAGGTAGFRWTTVDTSVRTGLYVQYDLRWNSADNSNNTKEFKAFTTSYPINGKTSDFTAGCNAGGYTGNSMGLSYSDDTVNGGDLTVQFFLSQFPTLTGGSAFASGTHPRSRVIPTIAAAKEDNTGNWQTVAHWIKQNTDGSANGEYAVWINDLTTPLFWIDQMINCYVGGQGFSRVDLGGYANIPGVIVDFRRFFAGYIRPTNMGI